MFALRSSPDPSDEDACEPLRPSTRNSNDWLTVEQAACELGVSDSTIRRRLRQGLLPSRVVPRKGGFAYQIYLPESRHGRDASLRGNPDSHHHAANAPIDLSAYRRRREQVREATSHSGRVEGQPERIPEGLLRALSMQARPVPAMASIGGGSPYGQYRQLVRRRRWWPF